MVQVRTNGQIVDGLEPLVRELQEQAGLADRCRIDIKGMAWLEMAILELI